MGVFMALFAVTYLFQDKTIDTGQLLSLVALSIFGLAMSVSAIAMFATVAETFDYDVLRALNRPVALQVAQRYFGQQLLAHLHTLDWGFRAGGTVITMKIAMNIATALAITALTALSQTIFNKIS